MLENNATEYGKMRQIKLEYEDWNEKLWQDFALQQFFREDDEVEYSLIDAKEINRP